MIRPKCETEDLLFSRTKNCEALFEQNQRKAEETLEFKMIKPRETFHFTPTIQNKGDCTTGLPSLVVYNSIFELTEEKNPNFINFLMKRVVLLHMKKSDEIEKDLEITFTDLQDDIKGPTIIEEFREKATKRMKDDVFMRVLANYVSSVFQNFENFLRTEIVLVEDDIKLGLDQNNSGFTTYQLRPGIYTFEETSEFLTSNTQKENDASHSINIEVNDITMKTKLIVRSGIIAIRFNENSFFSSIFGFNPHWDDKHYIEYFSQKIINFSATNKLHLKSDVVDGSIQNGLPQPVLYNFVLDKLSG